MPKVVKWLIIVTLLVWLYLFTSLYIKLETQELRSKNEELTVALQDSESRAALYSNQLAEQRIDIKLLQNDNRQMSATIEGDFYQESLDE